MNKISLTLSVLLLLWQKSSSCYGEFVEEVSDQGININLQIDGESNEVSVGKHGLPKSGGISLHITNIIFKLPGEASKSNDFSFDLILGSEETLSSEENSPPEETSSIEENHHKKKTSKEKSHNKHDHSKEKSEPHHKKHGHENEGHHSTKDITTIRTTPKTTKKSKTTPKPKTTTEKVVRDDWTDDVENDYNIQHQNLVVLSNSVNGAPPDVKVYASNGPLHNAHPCRTLASPLHILEGPLHILAGPLHILAGPLFILA
ncbi:hypothetical protein WDU94_007033 [Cyamophila willieti]